jgi:hypothetical protein
LEERERIVFDEILRRIKVDKIDEIIKEKR